MIADRSVPERCYKMKLVTNLSAIMGKQRMTQAELSRKTGIRQATIFQYYNDFWLSVKREHIEKICDTLHCSVNDLFGEMPE